MSVVENKMKVKWEVRSVWTESHTVGKCGKKYTERERDTVGPIKRVKKRPLTVVQ